MRILAAEGGDDDVRTASHLSRGLAAREGVLFDVEGIVCVIWVFLYWVSVVSLARREEAAPGAGCGARYVVSIVGERTSRNGAGGACSFAGLITAQVGLTSALFSTCGGVAWVTRRTGWFWTRAIIRLWMTPCEHGCSYAAALLES